MRLILFVLLTAQCAVFSCQNPAPPPAPKKYTGLAGLLVDSTLIRIWPKELDSLRRVDPNLPVIDVRSDIEFHAGHILRSMNCSVTDEDFEQRIVKIGVNTPVFLYDDESRRSLEAAEKMAKLGFKRIYELSGGIFTWARDGRVLISTASKADSATVIR